MKEKLYKYIFNPKKVDANTVDNFKDFDALYEEYDKSVPKTKRPGKLRKILPWIGVAAAAMVGLFITVFSPNKNKVNKRDLMAKTEFVKSPVADEVVQNFESATVDADKGGTIKIKQTTFHIPPKAFVNRAGNLVLGPVDIKLKEYHDYVDFFVSGIPMEYDSLGTRYQLESAGMIEVYAEQEGERVELALGKTLEIQLEAEIKVAKNATKAPAFNIYKLNEEKRNWVYEAEDKIEFIDEGNEVGSLQNEERFEADYKKEVLSIDKEFQVAFEKIKAQNPIPAEPIKPSKANSESFTFELDIEDLDTNSQRTDEHSSVLRSEQSLRALKKRYAKAVWEVVPGQPNWKPSIASTEWDDYNLKPLNQYEYLVTFIKGSESVDIKVKPVLLGDDYKAAMSSFNQEFAAFEVEKTKAEEVIRQRTAELEEAKMIRARTAKLALDEKIAALKAAGRADLASDELIKRKIVNMFSINSFGTWNCDRPFPAYVTKINAKFKDKQNNSYTGRIAYLVDDNRNTVFRFYADEGIELNYDEKARNIMWFVTKENKLAVYRPEDFKKVSQKVGKHTFVMDIAPDPIDSEEDIRKILDFD